MTHNSPGPAVIAETVCRFDGVDVAPNTRDIFVKLECQANKAARRNAQRQIGEPGAYEEKETAG
jgi:hypothetical protein